MEENNNMNEVNEVNEVNNVINQEPTFGESPKNSCGCGSNKGGGCRYLPIVNCVLLVGLLLLYIFHFTGIGAKFPNSKVNAEAKAPVAGESGSLKIAYVNIDTLMAKYDYARDLEGQLKSFQTAKENSYKQQMAQFQSDYESYIKGGADKMTLAQQQAKEKELQERAQKLQTLEGEFTLQIQEKTLNESEKMTKAVYNFIREYNEQNQQFDLILARSFSNSPILYGNEGMDITDEIVKGLNEEYANVKAEK